MAKKTESGCRVASDAATIDQVALVLQAMHHAIIIADQEAGDIQKVGYWNVLLEVATSHAHNLLTGTELIALNTALGGAGACNQISGRA